MKELVTTAAIVLGLLAAVLGIPRSHSVSTVGRAGSADAATTQGVADADKLPVQDFDDRSLVFPREMTR
jgi:hypothetical protein